MSLGPMVRIAYHVPGMMRRRQVIVAGDGSCAGGNDARELGVVVRGNEEVRRIFVNPVVPVIIDEVTATMSVCLEAADTIYLNGYNSWTDSVERPLNARMWGLSRVPLQFVDAHKLDAAGDYRFVDADTRAGHQHGIGYGYLRQLDEVLLFGSIDEDSGFTVIREDIDEGTLTFEKEPPARIIEVGESVEVLSLAVCGGRLDQAVDTYLALSGCTRRPAKPLVGYTTWRPYTRTLDAQTIAFELSGAQQLIGELDGRDLERVFVVEGPITLVGDWLEVDEHAFPDGMRAVADKIHEAGMRAGLWLAPFVCERDSKLFRDHPEWILRDERGDMVSAGGTWSDCFALDVRSDEVRSFVHTVISTVTRAWGFDFLKLDYLFAAASEVHDGLNRGQLMAEALDFLRECAGEATLLDFSGVPLVSAFGRCEYCRVGCDLTADWDDVAAKRILQRERRSTKNALANARGRAHLNGKAFLADPGYVSLLGTEINLTAAQRVQMLSTDCGCGGVLISADDLTAFDDESCAKAREHIGHFAQNQRSVVNTER